MLHLCCMLQIWRSKNTRLATKLAHSTLQGGDTTSLSSMNGGDGFICQAFVANRTLWFSCTVDTSWINKSCFFAHLSLAKSPQSCWNNKEAYVFDLFIYNASAVKTSVKLFIYSCVITSIILLLLSLVLESPDIFLREQTVAKLWSIWECLGKLTARGRLGQGLFMHKAKRKGIY